MPIVTAKKVHKAYGAHVVLGEASLTVHSLERVGVVGRNGAGKSTFARILAGLEAPDQGEISRRRGATVLYLDQVPSFDGDPSAEEAAASGLSAWSEAVGRYEEVSRALEAGGDDLDSLLEKQTELADEVERLGGWEQKHRVASMLGHLGMNDLEKRISSMSGGERRRVALARILIARPDLAILDEPTNHLDAETIEWLEGFLLDEYPGAVLLVTHDRYLLDRVASRTVEISDGGVYSYDGGYELYLEKKAERMAHVERTDRNRQNFLRKELEWLRRQPKARTTKQKARIDRAETARAVKTPQAERAAKFAVDVTRSGKTILELRELQLERGGDVLCDGLDLFVTQGERIGVVGRNGTGKTTLLSTLLGDFEPSSGTVTLGKNTKIAYLDQLRGDLDDELTVFENVVGDQSRIEIGGQVIETRSYLERFAFDGHQQRQPVSSLSGGERARVALARMLRQSANLVIMDEPTNDLDVATLGALESMLVDFRITAIVVTHDRWFLDRVATAILAFEGDGKVVRYPGNYDTFRRLRAQALLERKEQAQAERPTKKATREKPKKSLTRAEERELESLPDAIDVAEAKVAALTEELADPATYADGGKEAPRLTSELAEAKAEIEKLTVRWELLETKRSGAS